MPPIKTAPAKNPAAKTAPVKATLPTSTSSSPAGIATPSGQDEVIATFGDLRPYIQDDGTLSTNWEIDQMTRSLLPFPIPFGSDTTKMVTRIECHHLLAPTFIAVFQAIADRGLKALITTYDGCYAARAKRTSTHWSCHAWGIAIDLNASTNLQGKKGTMDPKIIAVFQEFGFKWGGEFSGKAVDPMHFQYATNY